MVFDADDTTLWTYDMEDAAMHFNFDPALQDSGSRTQRFPATPGMVDLVNAVERGLHGLRAHRAQRRPEGRHARQPRQGRLHRVHADSFFTKFDCTSPKPA